MIVSTIFRGDHEKIYTDVEKIDAAGLFFGHRLRRGDRLDIIPKPVRSYSLICPNSITSVCVCKIGFIPMIDAYAPLYEVVTPIEAARCWQKTRSTIMSALYATNSKLVYRNSGKTILITVRSLEETYGKPKEELSN